MTKLPVPTEKAVQAGVVQLLRSVGLVVRSTSQYRASHVAVGIPDLMVHGDGWSGWFEVKTYRAGWLPTDRSTWIPKPLRAEQAAFLADAAWGGQRTAWGGFNEAEQWLLDMGYLVRHPNGLVLICKRDRR